MTVGLFYPTIATLEISPNPVDNILYIRNPGEATHFRLIDILGRQVQELKTNGEETITMNVSNIATGIYMVAAFNAQQKLIANARIMKN